MSRDHESDYVDYVDYVDFADYADYADLDLNIFSLRCDERDATATAAAPGRSGPIGDDLRCRRSK